MAAILERGMNERRFIDSGRSEEWRRINGAYNTRQILRDNEETKQPQRERILDFILAQHKTSRCIRLMSMPGLRWPFEHQLSDRFDGGLTVVGLEWNWATIEMGMPWMIGERPRGYSFPLVHGDIRGISTVTGTGTRRAYWLWVNAGHFLTIERREKGSHGDFRRQFKGINAVWLDINTNLSVEAGKCLIGLPRFLSNRDAIIPAAFTMIAGQEWGGLEDGDDCLSRRLPPIKRAIEHCGRRIFEPVDSWYYKSVTGATMVNFMGLLIRREDGFHPRRD